MALSPNGSLSLEVIGFFCVWRRLTHSKGALVGLLSRSAPVALSERRQMGRFV
jgi:hypothetical protein